MVLKRPLRVGLGLLVPLLALTLLLLVREAFACGQSPACNAQGASLQLYLVLVCFGTLALAGALADTVQPVVFSAVPVAAFAVSTWSAALFTEWAPPLLPVEYAVVFTPPFMTATLTLAALTTASTSPPGFQAVKDTGMAVAAVGGATVAALALAGGMTGLTDFSLGVDAASAVAGGVLAAVVGFVGLPAEARGA